MAEISVEKTDDGLIQPMEALATLDQTKKLETSTEVEEVYPHLDYCPICWNKTELKETALIKGCEHSYCVTCILRWASIKNEQNEEFRCPMCKLRFEALNIHRALDGSIHDYLREESVCLLLRATWFNPLVVVERDEIDEETEDYYYEEAETEMDDEFYLRRSSNIRIGNRRFGDSGYVRAGRQEARPANRVNLQDPGSAGSSSRQPKKKENTIKETVGRRAKRTMKREMLCRNRTGSWVAPVCGNKFLNTTEMVLICTVLV